jgi:hypothetical protein
LIFFLVFFPALLMLLLSFAFITGADVSEVVRYLCHRKPKMGCRSVIVTFKFV